MRRSGGGIKINRELALIGKFEFFFCAAALPSIPILDRIYVDAIMIFSLAGKQTNCLELFWWLLVFLSRKTLWNSNIDNSTDYDTRTEEFMMNFHRLLIDNVRGEWEINVLIKNCLIKHTNHRQPIFIHNFSQSKSFCAIEKCVFDEWILAEQMKIENVGAISRKMSKQLRQPSGTMGLVPRTDE